MISASITSLGFDEEGRIHAVDATYAARCGFSSDLSGPVTDRALFHADSSYFYPHVHLTSRPLKTHTVSNTAFRGFGGPQGMLGRNVSSRKSPMPSARTRSISAS